MARGLGPAARSWPGCRPPARVTPTTGGLFGRGRGERDRAGAAVGGSREGADDTRWGRSRVSWEAAHSSYNEPEPAAAAWMRTSKERPPAVRVTVTWPRPPPPPPPLGQRVTSPPPSRAAARGWPARPPARAAATATTSSAAATRAGGRRRGHWAGTSAAEAPASAVGTGPPLPGPARPRRPPGAPRQGSGPAARPALGSPAWPWPAAPAGRGAPPPGAGSRHSRPGGSRMPSPRPLQLAKYIGGHLDVGADRLRHRCHAPACLQCPQSIEGAGLHHGTKRNAHSVSDLPLGEVLKVEQLQDLALAVRERVERVARRSAPQELVRWRTGSVPGPGRPPARRTAERMAGAAGRWRCRRAMVKTKLAADPRCGCAPTGRLPEPHERLLHELLRQTGVTEQR